jgi:hypothetical protein
MPLAVNLPPPLFAWPTGDRNQKLENPDCTISKEKAAADEEHLGTSRR